MYIGQTTLSVEERYNQHMKPSAHKKNYKIYKAIRKYGRENFYFEVLESGIPEDKLNEKEIYYIEKYNSFKNGYNSTKGGDGRIFNKIDDVEHIINGLQNGRMVKDIADELNVNTVTINRTLKSVGIENPSSIQKRNKKPELQTINREEVKELYIKGYTHNEISEILHIDQRSVSRIVKELNIETKKPRYDYDELYNLGILDDIKNGLKRKEILLKYNISVYVYYKILNNQKENSNDYPVKE